MGFSASGLRCMVDRIGAGPAMWIYSTTDAHTDVDADDYFTHGIDYYGMKVNDVVVVVDTDSNTCTIHMVRAVVTSPAASIAAATLA